MGQTRLFGDLWGQSMNNPWKRKGLFYKADFRIYRNGRIIGDYTKRLDFISYHVIKWIHGEKKLIDMAYKFELM